MLGAQRVAVGDRLRFAERREQAGARFREPARATRDRRRRRQRQQRRGQEPDGGKDRLLDQFRLFAEANRDRQYRTAAPDKQRGRARRSRRNAASFTPSEAKPFGFGIAAAA
jgi:hypothetical protein